MKKLRTLLVQFENKIASHQLSAFRGAVVEKVGREHVLFHQHKADQTLMYAYPLIQYKLIQQQASIVCIGEGVDEIHHFFGQKNWTINMHGEQIELKVDRLDLKSINLNIWEKQFDYSLFKWQALNEKNYREYNKLSSVTEKVQMLERILTGNILSFAKGVDWHIEQPVKLTITDISLERLSKMKDIEVAALDIRFRCNVALPDFIGLGKGVSKGFGILNQKNSK